MRDYSTSDIDAGIKKFNDLYGAVDDAILSLAIDSDHTDKRTVFAVVLLINSTYHTQIQDIHIDFIADRIISLANEHSLVSLIEIGDQQAVEIIANSRESIAKYNIELNKQRELANKKPVKRNYNIWSFATKYCAFHNPQYVIYDSIVRKLIVEHFDIPASKISIEATDGLGKYKAYCKYVLKMRTELKLPERITNKEFDQFLWLCGNKML